MDKAAGSCSVLSQSTGTGESRVPWLVHHGRQLLWSTCSVCPQLRLGGGGGGGEHSWLTIN